MFALVPLYLYTILLYFCCPDSVAFASFPDSLQPGAFKVGAILSVAGYALQFLSHFHLRDNWSSQIETKQKQTLITTGVYSRVAHPMYSSFILIGVGGLLVSANAIVGFLGLLVVAIVVARFPGEERMLERRFGDDYVQYRKKTGTFSPKFTKVNEEGSKECSKEASKAE